MEEDTDNDEKDSVYLQQMYKSLLAPSTQVPLGSVHQSQSTLSALSQSQSTLAALNRIQSRTEREVKPDTSLSPAAIEETVRIIKSNGAKPAKTLPKTKIVKGVSQAKQVSVSGTEVSAGGSLPSTQGPTVAVSLQTAPRIGSHIMGYKKRQAIKQQRPYSVVQDPYYRKWKRLKKQIKDMVFMNAAVCDQVVHEEEKVARAKEERRFLLRKLLHYQSVGEGQALSVRPQASNLIRSPPEESITGMKLKVKKKVQPAQLGEKKKTMRDLLASMKPKPKKNRSAHGGKVTVPAIPLDLAGRPIFPLVLGDLTLHSIGEIVPDRAGFHTSNSIFPVGYCSTRVYASLQNPDKQCLYTCKISDGGTGPVFEIVPEDNSEVFQSRFLSECHSLLLRALNQSRGMDLIETMGKGPDFFGLSHPVVQNLIQSCPGAKKCEGYKWIKFEVNKEVGSDSMITESEDPAVSFTALKSRIQGGLEKGSPSNLRSLLTHSLCQIGDGANSSVT